MENQKKGHSREENIKLHNKRNCLFCQPDFEKNESYRNLKVLNSNSCFAILDRNPKSLGHSLVICKTPFDDLTNIISDVEEREKMKTLEAAIDLATRLEKVLGAEKTYIMLMCEKWHLWETSSCITTEHFHFHLVPRYPGMRNTREAAEKLLAKDGERKEQATLEKIAQMINSSFYQRT